MHRLMRARDPETGQSMNEEQLVDNLLTFYLAGHETTAQGADLDAVPARALAANGRAALEDEIARVTGGAPVAGAHIERAGAGAAGAQGIDAPVSAGADDEPPGGRRHAARRPRRSRAGTSVVMPIYAIHRHARRWEDPDAFDPDALRAGARGADPALPVHAVRRRPAHLHRHGVRDDRGHRDARDAAAARALRARSQGHEPVPVARVTLHPGGGMPLHSAFARALIDWNPPTTKGGDPVRDHQGRTGGHCSGSTRTARSFTG